MFIYIHLPIFYVKVFYAISHINPRIRSIPLFDSKQIGRSASAPVIPTKFMLLKISLKYTIERLNIQILYYLNFLNFSLL